MLLIVLFTSSMLKSKNNTHSNSQKKKKTPNPPPVMGRKDLSENAHTDHDRGNGKGRLLWWGEGPESLK